MTRKLIVVYARILFYIEKSKQPLTEILSFSRDEDHVFAC